MRILLAGTLALGALGCAGPFLTLFGASAGEHELGAQAVSAFERARVLAQKFKPSSTDLEEGRESVQTCTRSIADLGALRLEGNYGPRRYELDKATVSTSVGTLTLAALSERCSQLFASFDPDRPPTLEELVDGYALQTKLEGEDLERFAPVTFRSGPTDCHLVVVRLRQGATFKSWGSEPERIVTRWGGADDEALLQRYGDFALAKLGCLVGARSVKLRAETSSYLDGKAQPAGEGPYEVAVYTRTTDRAEVERERAQVAAEKKRQERILAERSRVLSMRRAEEQIDDQLYGCERCRQTRVRCYQSGRRPIEWEAMGLSCDQGFDRCLQEAGWKRARCAP